MPRYYKSYDAYGEPVTLLSIPAEPQPPGQTHTDPIAEAHACIDADFAYDSLREQGWTHAAAREAIKKAFKL